MLRDPDIDSDQFVADTIERACEDQPDFVLLHDHLLGRRIAEAGCQRIAVLDGRSFQFVGPQEVPTTAGDPALEFTGWQHGRALDTRPDPGTITHPARFAILTVQPESGETSYAVVTVNPDASVTITPEIRLDVPYQRFVDTGTRADDRAGRRGAGSALGVTRRRPAPASSAASPGWPRRSPPASPR